MEGDFTVRGYHATSVENVQSILSDGFKPSRNSYDWLGEGIYFFQEAPNFSHHWGSEDRKMGKLDQTSVIGADISGTAMLDLLDHKWGPVLAEVYESLDRKGDTGLEKARGLQKPFEIGRDERLGHWLDRYIIEATVTALQRSGRVVKSIRAAFWEGSPIFAKSHIMNRQHIQICVRDESAILKRWQEIDPLSQ